MNKGPTIFSFFSGAGFLDLGFEKTGFNVAFVNEYHKPFMETYMYSRKVMNMPEPEYGYHLRDIAEFEQENESKYLSDLINKEKNKGRLVGFIGGPPCPDFSVGGKNRGQEGENGKLSATYVDLICRQAPDFFLFENVKGLWRTKKHRAFYDQMKDRLHDHNYVTTERLINSIEYGAPQYRERIILIGFKKNVLDKLCKHIDQERTLSDIFPWEKHLKYRIDVINAMPWPGMEPFIEDGKRQLPEDIEEELTVNYWFEKNDVENHPNAERFFTPKARSG